MFCLPHTFLFQAKDFWTFLSYQMEAVLHFLLHAFFFCKSLPKSTASFLKGVNM